MSRARLYEPRPISVIGPSRHPRLVAGLEVESIRGQWLVEDRWWSGVPLRRHYLELVLGGGRCAVIFCDLETGRWFEQR